MELRPPFRWGSLGQLALSGLGLLVLWGGALAVVLTVGLGAADGSLLPQEAMPLWVRAGGMALAGLLLVPSGYYALLSLLNRPAAATSGRRRTILLGALLAAAWLVALGAGELAARGSGLANTLIPPLYVLAVSLPVAWYLLVGSHGLPGGTPQRRWGVFAAGLVVSPLVILAVEIALLVAVAAAGVVAVLLHPEWADTINRLSQRLLSTPVTPESAGRILAPYLARPEVIYVAIALISGAIPLVEELLKPLPVWLLAGRRLTPAEGFVAGLLAGAGFALFESMGILSASTGAGWAVLAIGRAGTDLIHILNTGLMGWALASAWQGRGYLRLGVTYFSVAVIHGLWNLISLPMGILPLLDLSGHPALQWVQQRPVLPLLLGVMILILLGVMLRANALLRRSAVQGDGQSLSQAAEPGA